MHRGNVNEFLDKLRLEFGNRLAAKHLEQARHMDLSIPSFREQLKLLINFSVFREMQITRESSPGWTREQPPCLQSAWLLAQDECSIFQNQNKWHREMVAGFLSLDAPQTYHHVIRKYHPRPYTVRISYPGIEMIWF